MCYIKRIWGYCFCWCCFGGTRVWTQGFTIAKQVLYHLSISSPFCSGYFWKWGLENYLPGLASNCDPPDLSLQVARIRDVSQWGPELGAVILMVGPGCWVTWSFWFCFLKGGMESHRWGYFLVPFHVYLAACTNTVTLHLHNVCLFSDLVFLQC
jgi:hypothetical protein